MNVFFLFKRIRPASIVVLLALLGGITGCKTQNHDTLPKRSEIPDLQNLTLQMQDSAGNPAKLVNGQFQGDHLNVQLLKTAAADLNQDGNIDGAITAFVDPGGSGNFRYLFLFLNDGTQLVNTDKSFIGDRIRVTNLSIDQNIITVNYLDRASGDAMAVKPYINQQVQYHVLGTKLKEISMVEAESNAGQPD